MKRTLLLLLLLLPTATFAAVPGNPDQVPSLLVGAQLQHRDIDQFRGFVFLGNDLSERWGFTGSVIVPAASWLSLVGGYSKSVFDLPNQPSASAYYEQGHVDVWSAGLKFYFR